MSSFFDFGYNPWAGSYRGLGIGYASFIPSIGTGQSAIGSTSGSAETLNTIATNVTIGYTVGLGEYSLGLGTSYNPFKSKAAKFTQTLPGVGVLPGEYCIKNPYSVYITPGYTMESGLLYGKIGYAGSTVSISKIQATATNQNTELPGILVGVGYKAPVISRFYMLGELNYFYFPEKTAAVNLGTTRFTAPISGTCVDVIVGGGYRF